MHTPGAKLSATGLKWIAYACMLLDHFAYAFLYYRLSCMHCAAHRRQNGAAYFLLSFGGGLLPHQKRAPLFDAAADVCNDFAAVLQQLLRLSVYARMEIYGIFGRRQCVVYAVSCALSLVAWEHIKPLFARCAACAALFVCAALLPLDWG